LCERTVSTARLREQWRQRFDIDIADELGGHELLALRRCERCGLGFFVPPAAGSARLYAQLQKQPWYYQEGKWEHGLAERRLARCRRVLEIGCGSGAFLQRLSDRGIEACGLEMNPEAIASATARGLAVTDRRLEDVAAAEPGRYDAVCAFQVLEHVADPRRFLDGALRLLQPGGRLVLSMPDSAGFLRFDVPGLLNAPPHHVTQWSAATLRAVPAWLPLRLVKLAHEPLAEYHFDYYWDLQLGRVPKRRVVWGGTRRLLQWVVAPVLQRTGGYRLLRGASLYAEYERRP
jgi:2-polyprenyl-3-methyl-5-hydroxy-6-metoxy-1,4-benzoquinol methylase